MTAVYPFRTHRKNPTSRAEGWQLEVHGMHLNRLNKLRYQTSGGGTSPFLTFPLLQLYTGLNGQDTGRLSQA